ncbi:4-hydroxythreonine-4-phosphate dehydrogenase PdxA [Salinarimonas rosea]|uniref:4-hydroxythreonine-4-phosphate dehydrogenase PdxA n=1 Tax=Salinarimonas rosea TaxID=552063 RepID=UPI00048DB4E8|nr:4-hydroxythreonine-4-phosphate dehydrogenase PdxA [Salinarimonas rosea]
MASPDHPRPLALTLGDPAGIGPEIALAAWRARAAHGLAPFALVGDADRLARVARAVGIDVPVRLVAEIEEAPAVFDEALPVLPLEAPVSAEPGRPDPANAPAILESIERAVALARSGRAGGVVTCPIAKSVLYEAGFAHPGHTEFLAALAAEPGAPPPLSVMMLWSEDLAVVPVTVHIALAEVPHALTRERILAVARIVARDLRQRFGITAPRLALAGLNPHSGEGGAMGREEIDTIAPAIAALRAEGIDATGPHPADTLFHARARTRYDVALAMYHDQALVPIKTIAFDEAVNVTLGLPFIRTSPDHGTAFDIAGRGIARPDSLVAALGLAGRLAGRAQAVATP